MFKNHSRIGRPVTTMTIPNQTWTETLKIRLSETDRRAKLKISSIFNMFQDIASEHSRMLAISANALMASGYTWVVLRYNVDIIRYPLWSETITITTRRAPYKKLYEHREYNIVDESGALLIRGLSAWVMVDIKSRKPVRLSRFLNDDLMHSAYQIPDEFIKLIPPETTDHETMFQVRMGDLDFNGHVNNAIYTGWAIEALPVDILETCDLRHIEVHYLSDIAQGHSIVSGAKIVIDSEHTEYMHTIRERASGHELTRLRTVWEQVEQTKDVFKR